MSRAANVASMLGTSARALLAVPCLYYLPDAPFLPKVLSMLTMEGHDSDAPRAWNPTAEWKVELPWHDQALKQRTPSRRFPGAADLEGPFGLSQPVSSLG